jgi:hypothetical protein
MCRFEAIAKRYYWNNENKLCQFLPRLHGSAGQFVFEQLPQDVIENNLLFIRELNFSEGSGPYAYAANLANDSN